ncbi:hypothetical protein HZH68_015102 [Vespula germanica]|uniref:Uncharacterized protein n=1 Tax=Vespula germanica TaxID=30212 RepID=A0A834MU99_VESGE|nr:hypothetical protein HZH68_015102 [Vespula germanica]
MKRDEVFSCMVVTQVCHNSVEEAFARAESMRAGQDTLPNTHRKAATLNAKWGEKNKKEKEENKENEEEEKGTAAVAVVAVVAAATAAVVVVVAIEKGSRRVMEEKEWILRKNETTSVDDNGTNDGDDDDDDDDDDDEKEEKEKEKKRKRMRDEKYELGKE